MPRTNLRLVTSDNYVGIEIADPRTRKIVEKLTQELLDALIEMMDIADGDVDREFTGDEFEDGDGL